MRVENIRTKEGGGGGEQEQEQRREVSLNARLLLKPCMHPAAISEQKVEERVRESETLL